MLCIFVTALYFVTALLRPNLQAIKFTQIKILCQNIHKTYNPTILKCTIQRYYVHTCVLQPSAPSSSKTLVRKPQAVTGPPCSPLPQTHWSTSCLWICLLWTFHRNGITEAVAFWDWLISHSITFSGCIQAMLIASASTELQYCLLLNSIPLYAYITFYLSIHHWWRFGLFPHSYK